MVAPECTDLGEGAFVELTPQFEPDHEALLRTLLDELALEQESIVIFGREVIVPRLVAYHGEPGRSYRYSGRTHEPRPWTPALEGVWRRLRAHTGTGYDSVLVNYYRDGADAMGRHADDEPELGPTRDDIRIGSISLGARRTFRLKHRASGRRVDYALGEGDLLVMGGMTQRLWTHEVPRTKAIVGPRLNLTFRCVCR